MVLAVQFPLLYGPGDACIIRVSVLSLVFVTSLLRLVSLLNTSTQLKLNVAVTVVVVVVVVIVIVVFAVVRIL